jgi:hypothetical protein
MSTGPHHHREPATKATTMTQTTRHDNNGHKSDVIYRVSVCDRLVVVVINARPSFVPFVRRQLTTIVSLDSGM